MTEHDDHERAVSEHATLGEGVELPDHFGVVDDLAGAWVNTQARPQGLARVTVTPAEAPGAPWSLTVQPAGGAEEWAAVSFVPHVAHHGQTGFHARVEGQGLRAELIANAKLGVLVILTCTSFADGSGRAGYMLREFFRREQPRPFAPAPVELAPVELDAFEGEWTRTGSSSGFVEGLEVRRGARGWEMSTRLCDGRALGASALRTYRDNMGYLAFKARYELDGGACVMAANTQRELIVLTSFQRFGEGVDERNRAHRELLARRAPPR